MQEYSEKKIKEYKDAYKTEYELEAYKFYDIYVAKIPRKADGNFQINSTTAHNNAVDAFRHAFMSGRLTQDTYYLPFLGGEPFSKGQFDNHEINGKNSPLEHRMDLYNNELGRRFGAQHSGPDALAQAIANELKKQDSLFIKNIYDPRLSQLYPEDTRLAKAISILNNRGYQALLDAESIQGITSTYAGKINEDITKSINHLQQQREVPPPVPARPAPTTSPTNTYLDIKIRDPQNTAPVSSKTAGHNETDRSFLNGRVMGSGGFQVNMPANVLNGDGMKNVAPSFITSDGYRPGANELSTYGQAKADVQNTWNSLHPALHAKPSTPDTTWTHTHVSAVPDFLANTQKMAVLNTGAKTVKNIDPLILDLDGDGVHLTNFREKTVFFDVDNDGFQEQTGWVSATDGILVQDKNGDGQINDITETLSEHFVERAKDGFEEFSLFAKNTHKMCLLHN